MINLIVGIAGLPGSGKTTLAAALAPQIKATVFGFGDFFRTIASGTDLASFGQEYIRKNTPANVVDEFFQFCNPTPESRCVIDGIRHITIWQELRGRAERAQLIFLDVEEPTLLNRLMVRSGISLRDARRRLNHAVESEACQLREAAEIVLKQDLCAPTISRLINAIAELP